MSRASTTPGIRPSASGLAFRPYEPGRDTPPPGSVPLTVIVLTCNEQVNIARCLRSTSWAEQRIVVDSGSTDATVSVAEAAGAEVVVQEWLGFGAQREFALRHPTVRHEWVYFVDADEWVSAALAREIREAIQDPTVDGYKQRLRLIFYGGWIAHCGWYANSWVTRLVRTTRAAVSPVGFGERLAVRGKVGALAHDVVDEDLKGLDAWLVKHVGYAKLEARARLNVTGPSRFADVADAWRQHGFGLRIVAKRIIYPAIPMPVRPFALFIYMYLFRRGFMDGRRGLVFCLLHAWHEYIVGLFYVAGRARQRTEKGPLREAG